MEGIGRGSSEQDQLAGSGHQAGKKSDVAKGFGGLEDTRSIFQIRASGSITFFLQHPKAISVSLGEVLLTASCYTANLELALADWCDLVGIRMKEGRET